MERDANDCVFCRVLSGDLPSTVVFEDDLTLAFLDIKPAADGHTLVVPKRHTENLLTVNSEDLSAVIGSVQAVAHILDERLQPDGLSIFQANRIAGWQDVFHLHFHVVPRWTGDALLRPWIGESVSAERTAQVAARLARSATSSGEAEVITR